jgi:large subunit ribosomal protein L24
MSVRRLRKDDTVMVIAGRERGKTGKVLRVLAEQDRVLIERVNIVKKHAKPRGMQQPGGIVEREAAVHASNVVLICGRCNKPTRVGHRRVEDQTQRVCRRCGEVLEHA